MRSFKLLLVVGVAALMVLGVVPAASAAPVNDTVDNITYSADPANVSAGATAVSYNTAGGTTVSIPSTVTLQNILYNVTTVGDNAFAGDKLTSVTIPNSVTTIGFLSFSGNELTSVTIGNSVTTIGASAFENNALTSVSIPNSVITIGDFAFGSNKLTSVTIPSSVTTIGDYAFDSTFLTSVQFLGAAPSMGNGSLGSAEGLLVSFFARYGPPTVIGGFTTPQWSTETDRYNTQALVDVSYSTNGGDGLAPPDSQPPVGSTFSAPADPSWAGHTFTGWFTAASGGTAWNFGTDIVSTDITLYAQWSSIPTLAATGIDMTQQSRITDGAATMLLLGIAAIIIHRRRRKGNL